MHHVARSIAATALLSVILAPLASAAGLQVLVNATPKGGVLRPPPGVYRGSIKITKPITIDGGGNVEIDGEGRGSVIQIRGNGVTLRGLHIRGSGENHDTIDSGVSVRGHRNVIEDNTIDDCLFGIDLGQSNENVIRRNKITSKPLDLGLRGDGIRLWYSRDNQIVHNEIRDVRDIVVWYSAENLIAHNTVVGGRYALHFMYSKRNRVEDNRYSENMVGVFLMYSDGVELRRNQITQGVGATSMGVGFKESSNVLLEDNTILRCATGIYLDISPYEPDTNNRFVGNRIAYNSVGVVFHSDWHGNIFEGNDFDDNFTQVAVRGGGGATRHTWRGNRWADYRGFDRNRDGIGDQPYELFSYADRFWVDRPHAAFFRASPLFEVIDMLDRLAPFTEPTLVVRDEEPRFVSEAAQEGFRDDTGS
ncbi:MAG: nitrous oxide reductase family maturation protein NosD [Deltaproteobacteria bacterium]|nr:nitrous oxide reductase family maturation protein NosD [Deltaproteobacteria bacterium]MBW2723327.1 nitrous oxide reductase family maturation protein NosD [Deltaproteobacteria bacterium]